MSELYEHYADEGNINEVGYIFCPVCDVGEIDIPIAAPETRRNERRVSLELRALVTV